MHLDGFWEGTGWFIYELGAICLDRGSYNPEGLDYPAAGMATAGVLTGRPRSRAVIGPPKKESGCLRAGCSGSRPRGAGTDKPAGRGRRNFG